MQTKHQLEKLYTGSEKIEEQISIQRPSYDKTRLGFFLGQSTMKSDVRKELDPKSLEVKKDMNMIKSDDTPKEKENVMHFEKKKR